ncbi:PREDICTED: BRCA1-associated RING domain protein 1 [Nanorana parkeri]|uniref:BRCA1-associated RING domain protein 1 n=1 Tax=Nanorana parkeri TaxID=125878 RepID=UPI00085420ED|nr:PREDICTED: BRCA1-associated RING domain protein 1 [Nanorana parkeri]
MPLRVRSGNRPPDSGDSVMIRHMDDWSRTREALRELEEKLCCSVCLLTLKQPVCLGGCEHVFCRTCVGDNVGNECPLCHTPAWVKDVQINRQLDNIIHLCSRLNSLLDKGKQDENDLDLCQDASLKQNTTQEKCNKNQIKMRFSPRRGKVRYVLEKGVNQQIPSKREQIPVLETYEFVSSSPDIEPMKKKRNNSKPRKSKKKKLADINQEWGVGAQTQNGDDVEKKDVSKTIRSVSFCSSPVVVATSLSLQENDQNSDSPVKKSQTRNVDCFEEHTATESKNSKKLTKVSPLKPSVPVSNTIVSKSLLQQDCVSNGTQVDGSNQDKNKSGVDNVEEKNSNKKPLRSTRQKNALNVTPKRENTSLKRKERPSVSPVSTTSKRSRQGPLKPRVTCKSEEIEDIADSKLEQPQLLSKPSTPSSKNGRRTSQTSACIQMSPSSPFVSRKNIKGETLLHVASIKGDLKGVEELLKNGANPNVKDNAGWTPLHEACNHGHSVVVELLIQYQALVNTAGYQNDTPLHDAAKNGHVAIVKLLLNHGASPNAINIFGLRPVDYAETEEIKLALLQAQKNKEPLVKLPCSALNRQQRREEPVVLLASGLSASQKTNLAKLASLLKAEICSNYSSSVTHLIVGEDPMLRTLKCMMGMSSGCWILQYAWVKTCLESCGREPEEAHEVKGGPQKARLNREQMLPKLLDGCHFYFLGSFKEHKKEDLTELVKAAGGQILIRQPKPDSDVTQTINTVAYHADADSDQRFCTQYIIYDKTSKYVPGKVRQGKVWFAPSSWLIDCIICFQLLPVQQE